jgi:hypothetical protein
MPAALWELYTPALFLLYFTVSLTFTAQAIFTE